MANTINNVHLSNGDYCYVEPQIYKALLDSGVVNRAVICGVLANAELISEFDPHWSNDNLIFNKGILGFNSDADISDTITSQINFLIDVQKGKKAYYKLPTNISENELGARIAGQTIYDSYIDKHALPSGKKSDNEKMKMGDMAREYWNFYVTKKNEDKIYMRETPEDPDDDESTETEDSNIPAYYSLSSGDDYSLITKHYTNEITSRQYDYGYLIDLTSNKSFKFYIPEFSETAGANWESIEIPGRSVEIKSYRSTKSRAIVVSLDLYAGIGLYTSGDVVTKMHDDINFVKSLEYPDYSNTAMLKPPATVQLVLGPYVNFTGVVNDVKVDHLKPRDSRNRSMYVKLSFSVTQTAFDPPGAAEIRGERKIERQSSTPTVTVIKPGSSKPSNMELV